MEIHNGKTLLTYLDQRKNYKIYSDDNRVISTILGEKLYQGHYDKVEKTVREHYSKVQEVADKVAEKSAEVITTQTTRRR